MQRWRSLVLLAACGGGSSTAVPAKPPDKPATAIERAVALLPDGAQLVVEIDLARLRGNAVVGPVAARALVKLGGDSKLPGLPVTVQGSPLAGADAIVLAAYGVGTSDAAAVTLLVTKADVDGATRLAPDLVAIGPTEWVAQLEARAQIARTSPLVVPKDLLELRAHATPPGATGAVLRVTARLSFDARVALARQTGLDAAPARLSVWGDVADDLAIVVDADAADPGDKGAKDAPRKLAHEFRGTLASLAEEPVVKAIGVRNSLVEARMIAKGSWLRTIIAIGPRHLARAVERANELLGAS